MAGILGSKRNTPATGYSLLARKKYGTTEQRAGSAQARIGAEKKQQLKTKVEQQKKQETFNEAIYGPTTRLIFPASKKQAQQTVAKQKELTTAFKRLQAKGPVGEALVERPSYGQRVKEKIATFPQALQPLAAPIAALEQAPFMLGTREALGTTKSEEQGYKPVSGGGKIAGQILAPLHQIVGAQNAGLAGGQLYNLAGEGIAKFLPGLVNTVGGRVLGKTLQGVAEGIPTNIGATLAANPQATPQELKEAALYGAGFGILPGLGKLASEGLQAGTRAVLRPTLEAVTGQPITTRVGAQAAREVPMPAGEILPQRGEIPAQPIRTTVQPTVTEPLVTTPRTREQGVRSFPQTLEQSGRLTPETLESLKASPEQRYEPITNVGSLEEANRRLSQNGIDKTEGDLLSKEKFTADDVATGIRLIDELQKSGNTQRAVTIAENLSKALTEAGQAVQAASIVNRLSPEGSLLYATNRVQKLGKTLKTEDAESILDLATAIQKSGTSSERATTVMDISAKLKNKEKLTSDEFKEITSFVEDAQSMLGKPKAIKAEKPAKLPSDKKIREQLLTSLTEKEDALKEFIRQNSRRVSSTPLDLWGAYAALGAIKMAKGAISFSKWSEQMIKDVGENIRPHLSNLFDRSQNEAKQLQHLLPDKTAAEKIAQKYIDADQLTPKDAQLIHDLATRIGKMNTNDKMAASREMQAILNKYEKGSIADKINAFRYIAMLGNTSTQLVNAMSSPIMMLERYMLDMIQTPFDIARSKITGGPRQITFKQGPKVWDNFLAPVGDYGRGAKIGGESGWKGIDPNGITTQTDMRGLAFKSKWNPARWAEGALGAVMKGADNAAYNAAVGTKLRQMAYLDALNKGIEGDDAIRNYMDRYLNNLDENIIDVADRFGKEMTFQQRSKASQGAQATVRGLNKLSTGGLTEKTGLGSALLPFVKTPTNLMIAGLERTPLGLVKGFHQLATMSKNPDITPAEIASTFAKVIWGTAGLTGAGYTLGKLGILTGDSASSDKNVQALEADVGKGKFKFNTSAFDRMMKALVSGNIDDIKDVSQYRPSDKQLNYNKLQPFAFPVAAGATFAEQQRQAGAAEARGGEIPFYQQAGKAASSGLTSIYDMSLLKGLQDAFDVQPGQKPLDIAKEIAQNYLKSFSPSLLAQEARRQDISQRQVTFKGLIEPVKQQFQARLPGQSQKLPPKVTTMGEIKRNEPGIIGNYLNPLQSSRGNYNEASQIIYDWIQKTGDEGLAPKPVDKNLSGKKGGKKIEVTLDARETAKLQQTTGEEITRQILAMPKGLTPEEAADNIKDIYEKARKKARDEMKKGLGWD